jgi:hypothetical protein
MITRAVGGREALADVPEEVGRADAERSGDADDGGELRVPLAALEARDGAEVHVAALAELHLAPAGGVPEPPDRRSELRGDVHGGGCCGGMAHRSRTNTTRRVLSV